MIKELEIKETKGILSRNEISGLFNGVGNVTIFDDLDVDKLIVSAGYAVLKQNSTIGLHAEDSIAEIWIVLSGTILCNGYIYKAGDSIYFPQGTSHSAHNVSYNEAVIRFIKLNAEH